MTRDKVLLDPYGRRMVNIFRTEDLARLHSVADVIWARDEPAPEAVIDEARKDLDLIITGGWRHGDVARYPKLRAILEVSGGFPSL